MDTHAAAKDHLTSSHEATPSAPRIAEALLESVGRYSLRLQELAGPRVLGLALYGGATELTFDPSQQAAKNVVVFDAFDLDLLQQIAGQGTHFGRLGIAAPLAMTPEFIQKSLDTFPLELLEIQQQHLMVFGGDYFSRLEFQAAHVRLQCERELKAIMVGMHQGLLSAAGREQKLAVLEAGLADELLRVLRGVRWLKGDRQAKSAFPSVEAVEKLLGRNLPGVLGALDQADAANWHKFRNLYADVQALGHFVDGL